MKRRKQKMNDIAKQILQAVPRDGAVDAMSAPRFMLATSWIGILVCTRSAEVVLQGEHTSPLCLQSLPHAPTHLLSFSGCICLPFSQHLSLFLVYVCIIHIYIYIYIWRRPRFLPTLGLFARQKQHILAILRQKREKGRNKRKTKLGRAFLVEKCTFFPNCKPFFA